jgi:hypothetical protein
LRLARSAPATFIMRKTTASGISAIITALS